MCTRGGEGVKNPKNFAYVLNGWPLTPCPLLLQLVTHNDVKKMYRKACLAVHPDKQMGSDNENISKLIFTELNDAWAKFQEEEAP